MTVYGTYTRMGETYNQYGRNGSTIADEFNRLANGGEYPNVKDYIGVAAAINKWKSYPNSTGIMAALNNAAGYTTDPKKYLDFIQIINYYLEAVYLGETITLNDPKLSPVNLLSAVQALRLIAS